LVAEMLAGYGVRSVFGQPGGQTAALYDGIARREGRIRHFLTRDERSAAYAADAYARITGRPGVCDVTVGPGTTKLADGLVESYNASVPIVALVGELPLDWAPLRDRGVGSQGFDQIRFLQSITKQSWSVPSVDSLPQMVRLAFRTALAGRPGPVALAIPHDLLDAEWSGDPDDAAVDDRYMTSPAFRPCPVEEEIAAAARLLDGAERPAIVAGGGALASGASDELIALADANDAVVVTSFSGKGIVPETGPHAAGVLNPLGSPAATELIRAADLVIWCGCKVGQNTSLNWALPLPRQVTIQIDIDATELGRTFRPSVALNGDVKATLSKLMGAVGPRGRPGWRAEVEGALAKWVRERTTEQQVDGPPVAPPQVMRELSDRLQAGDVAISDASFAAGWLATYVPAKRAARDFLFARGQGGLGYAVPAALGAAAARPGKRVVTVNGDGGFSYAIGELATHAQHRTQTIHIVLNNGKLGWLQMWQHLYFEGLRQSVDLETKETIPDLAGAAAALGCVGISVRQPSELAGAFHRAFAASGPVVVDVRIDSDATPIRSFRRRLREGKFYPRPGTVYELRPWTRSPESYDRSAAAPAAEPVAPSRG
jgi:acetolactate synthase-1/2/3 large subunit